MPGYQATMASAKAISVEPMIIVGLLIYEGHVTSTENAVPQTAHICVQASPALAQETHVSSRSGAGQGAQSGQNSSVSHPIPGSGIVFQNGQPTTRTNDMYEGNSANLIVPLEIPSQTKVLDCS